VTPASGVRVRETVAAADLTHVSVACVDWNGRLRAKQLHVRNLDKIMQDGTAFTTAIFATDTTETPMDNGVFQDPANGYRDAALVFDDASFYPDPLHASGAGALLFGQLDGEHARYCPRAILAQECARLRELGFDALCAYEIECHVLQETLDSLSHKVPGDLVSHPDFGRMYSYVDQAEVDGLLSDLRHATATMGIPLDSLHIEFRGLLEAGLAPSGGERAADRLVLYKAIVKALARRRGALTSFMAQLSNRHESAGGHLNVSLISRVTGAPAFHDASDPESISALCRAFLGGLQRHVPEYFLLFAPHLNSYKRFGEATFIPTRNTWALGNKTAAFRVINVSPGLTRIELRIPGADIQPHLALAATLAAGRRGIEAALAPTAQALGNALREPRAKGEDFPGSFREAIARWRESACVRETFGAEFVEAFALSRDWQIAQFERTVTDWEVRQFGECV